MTSGEALREFYADRFFRLTSLEKRMLEEDVEGIMAEESLPARQAVQALDRRIWNALESYATTLADGR